MRFRQDVVDLVDAVLAEFGGFDLEVRAKSGGGDYLARHRHEYLRTVQDVLDHAGDRRDLRVLELGAFFGVVSICLARLGFPVTASDFPEYMEMPAQQRRFGAEGIAIHTMRLQDFVVDRPDESHDVVIMCEVLEHLNFNPLPLIKEINRILAVGGLFYVATPNAASIYNRMRLARGNMIGLSVQSFFDQLDPNSNVIVYGHWREYTGPEVRMMLERLGFEVVRQYYFSLGETQEAKGLRKTLARRFYAAFPALKENQTTMAVKRERTPLEFVVPKTVHPEIERI